MSSLPHPLPVFPLPAFSHIHRTPTAAQQSQSKQLFQYGFFCVPFLWITNYIMFRETLQWEDTPINMKRYVRYSCIGFIVAIIIFVIWLVVYYQSLNGGFSDNFTVFDVLDNPLTQGTYS